MPRVIKPWSDSEKRTLVRASQKCIPAGIVAQRLGRNIGAVRQKARLLGFSLGVKQRGVATRAKARSTRRKLDMDPHVGA